MGNKIFINLLERKIENFMRVFKDDSENIYNFNSVTKTNKS